MDFSSLFSVLVIFIVAIKSGITGHGLGHISFELIGLICCILCEMVCKLIENIHKKNQKFNLYY